MIVDNLTSIPVNSPIVEYMFAFDNMLGNYAIFAILLAILTILTISIYVWRQDFVFAFKNSVYLVSFGAFLMTLVKSTVFSVGGDALRLLSFEKFTFFLILLVLVVFYDEVSG